MILQALCDYYQRKQASDGSLAPIGFEQKEIPFVIVLNPEGQFIQLLDTREGAETRKPRGRLYTVPQGKGRSGSKSHEVAYCLWDHFGYVLNQPKVDKPDATPTDKDRAMAAKQHESFVALVKQLNGDLPEDTGVAAVMRFLNSDAEKARVKSSAEWGECLKIKGCNLSFKLLDEDYLVCQSPAVRDWVGYSGNEETSQGFCLVKGEQHPIARLHSVVKGVWGAQVAGANIVSFNFDAFESWNKSQGANSPVSEQAVFEYTTALNDLLRTESPSRFQLGETSVVCWAEQQAGLETTLPALFSDPPRDNPEQGTRAVKALFDSLHNGAYQESDGSKRFFILGLAPNASRIAVRFWQQGTVADFSERLGQWYSDIDIESRNGRVQPPLKELLRCTALRNKDENMSPHLVGETVRAVLSGRSLPANVLQAVIKRIKAERGNVELYRACLVKAYLNRLYRYQQKPERELTVGYNPEEKRIGYRLGCLFAVMEKLQQDANPGLNATIRDRYYSSASCTPRSVVGTLMRMHTHHLKKMENPTWRSAAQRRIGDIMAEVSEFPAHLNLEEQGLFAIGYYHQRQALFTRKESPEGEPA